ncbi:MAG: hypothetical protein ABIJ81_02005, partial [Patescibacteria group bacterium]
MNKRFFIAFLIALPFLWFAAFAYANWLDPSSGVTPPDENLPGPVWLLPDSSGVTQGGNITIDGIADTDTMIVSGASNPSNTLSVYQYAAQTAVYAYTDSAYLDTSWAGYFDGRVFAKKYCLPPDASPNCIASWSEIAAAGGLWSLEGTGPNIFKGTTSNTTGIVAIGASNPSTVLPGATQSRLYISPVSGNPEIDLGITATANNHWGIYADVTGAGATKQLRFWTPNAVGAGVNQFAFTNQGVMVFYGWQPQAGSLVVNVSGTGTVTSNDPAQTVNCSTTNCTYFYGLGSSLTLTAQETGSDLFKNWTGACTGTSTSCTVTIAASTIVNANFITPGTPIVTTGSAGEITSDRAILFGTLNLNGTQIPSSPGTPSASFAVSTQNRSCVDLAIYGYGFPAAVPFTDINLGDLVGDQIIQESTTSDVDKGGIRVGDGNDGLILEPNTTYYYCAFFYAASLPVPTLNKYFYGQVKQFTTATSVPILISPTATSITHNSATLGANITSSSNFTIAQHGTCWGTTSAPNISTGNCSTKGAGSLGVFTDARNSLTAGTKLYYRGYATNSIGTGYSPDASFYTEPSTQASGISFTSVGTTSMIVNWIRGNGDGVIVLMKSGAPVGTNPADGTYSTYSANPVFSSGSKIGVGLDSNYVVYKDTGTSVEVTGLSPSTTYYVAVYEYKGKVDTLGTDQGTNYKTPAATGNQATGSGIVSYTLSLTKNTAAGGTVTSSPSGISCGTTCTSQSASYNSGTSVTLTASSASGYTFAGWSGACTGTGSCAVSMTAARSVTATFNTTVTTYTLSLTKNTAAGGTVTSSPSGISCGTTCTSQSASYNSGTSVT